MSVMSMSLLPAADAAAPRPGAGPDGTAAAGGFGALVAAHLATITDATAAGTAAGIASEATVGVAEPIADDEPAPDAVDESAGTCDEDGEDNEPVDVAGPGLPVAPNTLVPVPVAVPGTAGAARVGPAADAGVGPADPAPADSTGRSQVAVAASLAGSKATDRASSGGDADGAGPLGPLRTVSRADQGPAASGSTYPAPEQPGAAGGAPPSPASPPPVSPAPVSPAPVSHLPVGPAIADPAAATGQPTERMVTSQVFPTVPALVSRGEGTHSITLRLHPADLGEVHVTVTVRDGGVEVTMAADPRAQEALRAGSGELRSLLDLAGAATGQVVIRDLPGGAAPVVSTATSGTFHLPTGQASTEGGHGQGQAPPGSRSARPGATADDVPESGPAHRPQPRATAGLDLTL